MKQMRSRHRKRRGISLMLVALSVTALGGVGALAVDLGMLYKARADALYAAEAGALAGASAFLDFQDPFSTAARDEAGVRARQYTMKNRILNDSIRSSEVRDSVIPESQKVRVFVRRAEVNTWFARLLQVDAVAVFASAAAQAEEGDATICVKPLMIPDLWDDDADTDDNGLEDNGEQWSFDERVDDYQPFDPPGSNQTGYGSDRRGPEGDRGRQIEIRPRPSPETGQYSGPNGFNLWEFQGPAGPSVEESLEECDGRSVNLEDTYDVVPQESSPSIGDEIQGLIDEDPSAAWLNGNVVSPKFPDWRNSPRVIKIALYNPESIGGSTVQFNNIALFFIESMNNENIVGRFLYYVTGTSGGEPGSGGSLIKHVRLVE